MSTTAHSLSHLKYRPDIDGLRAIAVLAVVAYHAFPGKLKGGFTGVDIFFVISGFLISGIILKSLNEGTFSFAEFYARRVKRIFPPLLLVMGSCYAFGWFALLDGEFAQLGKHIAGGAAFVANFVFWQEAGYFDSIAETKPLLHLWSLGVEEQFYILWPVMLCCLWRVRKGVAAGALVVVSISFALNLYFVRLNPEATFYLPHTRFWELMLGAVLAWVGSDRLLVAGNWVSAQRARLIFNIAAFFGMSLIVTGILTITKQHQFPGGWALLPVSGAVLIIGAGPNAWINRVVLGHPVMRWFGLISFSLYLWHWPLLSFAAILENGVPSRNYRVGAVAASIILAWLTYRFVETPFRRSQHSAMKVQLLLASMAILGAAGFASYKWSLPEARLANLLPENILLAINDWGYPGNLKSETWPGASVYRNIDTPPEVLVVGDSHVEQYGPRAIALTEMKRAKSIAFMTGGGCPAIPGVRENQHPHCAALTNEVFAYLRQYPTIKAVVIGGYWNGYFIEHSKPTTNSASLDYVYQKGHATYRFREGGDSLAMQGLREFLQELSKTTEVYLLLDNPQSDRFNPRRMLPESYNSRWETLLLKSDALPRATINSEEFSIPQNQLDLITKLQKLTEDSSVQVLNPMIEVCPQGKCHSLDETGHPIYKDSHHLRPSFVRDNIGVLDNVLLAH
ncbi:acyltransferase family protein [Pseudomonas sp. NFX71]|uniref:acyltransferase family protein n=1 Tax=Pseudomonas sp. NFX71 TaxID=3399121 RepID=UPI003A8A6789